MNLKSSLLALLLLISTTTFWAQEDAVIQNIIEEGLFLYSRYIS